MSQISDFDGMSASQDERDTEGFTQILVHATTEEQLILGIDVERREKLLVGVASLAMAFDVTPQGVRAWLRRELIPRPQRVGGRLLWSVDELRRWINDGCKPCPVGETVAAERNGCCQSCGQPLLENLLVDGEQQTATLLAEMAQHEAPDA